MAQRSFLAWCPWELDFPSKFFHPSLGPPPYTHNRGLSCIQPSPAHLSHFTGVRLVEAEDPPRPNRSCLPVVAALSPALTSGFGAPGNDGHHCSPKPDVCCTPGSLGVSLHSALLWWLLSQHSFPLLLATFWNFRWGPHSPQEQTTSLGRQLHPVVLG